MRRVARVRPPAALAVRQIVVALHGGHFEMKFPQKFTRYRYEPERLVADEHLFGPEAVLLKKVERERRHCGAIGVVSEATALWTLSPEDVVVLNVGRSDAPEVDVRCLIPLGVRRHCAGGENSDR